MPSFLLEAFGRKIERPVPSVGGFLINKDENEFGTVWEKQTSYGFTTFTESESGLLVSATDRGMVCSYDQAGELNGVLIEVFNSTSLITMEQIENIADGGNAFLAALETMELTRDRIFVEFDLEFLNKKVSFYNIETGVTKLQSAENIKDIRFPVVKTVKYGNCEFMVKIKMTEYGCLLSVSTDGGKMTLVLNDIARDINYKTYLEDKRSDRLDRLARRIFSN